MDETPTALPRHLKPREVTVPRQEPEAFAPPNQRSILAAVESELSRKPLDEIAARIARLTYGEMKEFCAGIEHENVDTVWDWATKGK